MIYDTDLAAMLARANAATAGPWKAGSGCVIASPHAPSAPFADPESVLHYGGALIGESISRREDCEFIADARTDIPRLIAEVMRLREELGQGRAA